MKKASAFTLVELLVVITILAIISVVAYTQFGGVTDKAKNSAKMNDLTSLETGLNSFYTDNNYYPLPSARSATSAWWYDATATATVTSTIKVTLAWDQISSVDTTGSKWGGKIEASWNQFAAKGVIDSEVLPKKYLSKELLDPSLKDIKVWVDKTFADYGIGKYIYSVYAKPAAATSWNVTKKSASAFALWATLLDEQKWPMALITTNFDKNTCITVTWCPDSLISDGATSVKDKSLLSPATADSTTVSAGVPYMISNFK